MKCLIVENNVQDCRLLKRMLTPFGPSDVAENGEVAFGMYKMAQSNGDPYDVIFLDIMMPGMDGNELLRLIRQWESNHSESVGPVQIVMASSKTDTDTIVQSYDDGCQHFFMKPYDLSELIDLMKKMGFSEKVM